MSRGFTRPPNYTIRSIRNYTDRWEVYRLLILEREAEPSHSKLAKALLHPYTLILLALPAFILLFIASLSPVGNWFYILLFLALYFLGFVGCFQLILLYDLFIASERRYLIALYQGQVISVALMAFRENYSVLLGLYVAPSHRRRGVGSYLLQYLLQRNERPTYLNAPANLCPFYARFGFVLTSELRGYNMVRRVLN